MDPDHAMKLSDVGVERPPHMGSSRRAGGSRNKRTMSIMLRAVLCLALGYALALAVLVGYIAAAGGRCVRRSCCVRVAWCIVGVYCEEAGHQLRFERALSELAWHAV